MPGIELHPTPPPRGGTGSSPRIRGALLGFLLLALSAPVSGRVVISEILFDPTGENTGRQWIELHNLGDEAVDVGGHWLRYAPAEYRLPNSTTIPAGSVLLIHLNRSGVATPGVLFTGIGGQRNLERTDAIALHSSGQFHDPAALVDHVQWGDPAVPGDQAEVLAIEAGLWSEGERVSIDGLRPGNVLLRQLPDPGAGAWCVSGSTSPGSVSTLCTPPRIVSGLRLNEVVAATETGGSTIELLMEGTVQEPVGGYALVWNGGSFILPPEALARPGELITIRFEAAGDPVAGEYFAGEAVPGPSIDAAGELALYGSDVTGDPSWLIDYLAWGEAGASPGGPAVEAGLWSEGTFVDTGELLPASSIAVVESRRDEPGVLAWELDHTPTAGLPNSRPPTTDVVLNEVLIVPNGAGLQAIEVTNRGSLPVELETYSVCSTSGPVEEHTCTTFPPGFVIDPGEYVVIWLDGRPGVVDNNIFIDDFAHLDPGQGELSLIRGDRPELVGSLLDHLRWGVAPAPELALAVQAGIWPAGGVIPTGSPDPGTSLAYLGSGRGPDRYTLDTTPTLGVSNKSGSESVPFSRGDCTTDGIHDISDPVLMLAYQFTGAGSPTCFDACDTNDDAALDITDAIASLGFLFLGLSPPPPPLDCELDPTPDQLTCVEFNGCEES